MRELDAHASPCGRSTRARVPEQAQAQKRRCMRMRAHTEQRMRMHGLGGQTRSARVASTHADGTTATVVRRAGVGVRAPRRRSLARRKSAAHTDVQGTPAMLLKQRNMDPCMRQAMRHARRKPRANAPYISKRVKRKGRQYQATDPSERRYERRWCRPCPKLSPPRAFVYCWKTTRDAVSSNRRVLDAAD